MYCSKLGSGIHTNIRLSCLIPFFTCVFCIALHFWRAYLVCLWFCSKQGKLFIDAMQCGKRCINGKCKCDLNQWYTRYVFLFSTWLRRHTGRCRRGGRRSRGMQWPRPPPWRPATRSAWRSTGCRPLPTQSKLLMLLLLLVLLIDFK